MHMVSGAGQGDRRAGPGWLRSFSRRPPNGSMLFARAMPRFRVMLQGAPVFLLNVDSQKTDRLGFYTTRWVRAASVDEARSVARRLVLDEFATSGTKNPPEQPIQMAVEDVVEVSWFEAARKGPGRGFTFYPDAIS
jgi:hypothetical protein